LVRILLLGPDRWPAATQDPHAGLKIRREIVKESSDLDAEWILMEDDPTPGDATQKFLALAVHPSTTHVFLIWPRNAKMVGTEDELVLWQAISLLTGKAPECYLFHQRGVLRIDRRGGEDEVVMDDDQGKSPYLYGILRRGVFEQEWVDLADLKHQIQEVLRGDLGVPTKGIS
jgi:hypothetical protein